MYNSWSRSANGWAGLFGTSLRGLVWGKLRGDLRGDVFLPVTPLPLSRKPPSPFLPALVVTAFGVVRPLTPLLAPTPEGFSGEAELDLALLEWDSTAWSWLLRFLLLPMPSLSFVLWLQRETHADYTCSLGGSGGWIIHTWLWPAWVHYVPSPFSLQLSLSPVVSCGSSISTGSIWMWMYKSNTIDWGNSHC